jgi:hypothetical protein
VAQSVHYVMGIS